MDAINKGEKEAAPKTAKQFDAIQSRADRKDQHSDRSAHQNRKDNEQKFPNSKLGPSYINRFYPLIKKRIPFPDLIDYALLKDENLYNALKKDIINIFLQHKYLFKDKETYTDIYRIINRIDGDENELMAEIILYLKDECVESELLYQDGYFGIRSSYNNNYGDQPIYLRRAIIFMREKFGFVGEQFIVVLYCFLRDKSLPNSIISKLEQEEFIRYVSGEVNSVIDMDQADINRDGFIQIKRVEGVEELENHYLKEIKKHNDYLKKMIEVNSCVKSILESALKEKYNYKSSDALLFKYFSDFANNDSNPNELRELSNKVLELSSLQNYANYICKLSDEVTYVCISDIYRFVWDCGDYGDIAYADYNNMHYEAEGIAEAFKQSCIYWPTYAPQKTILEKNEYEDAFIHIWKFLTYISE